MNTNKTHASKRNLSVNGKAEQNDKPEERTVDLDKVPVYNMFKFCCSKNTNRIYLYDEVNSSDLAVHVMLRLKKYIS